MRILRQIVPRRTLVRHVQLTLMTQQLLLISLVRPRVAHQSALMVCATVRPATAPFPNSARGDTVVLVSACQSSSSLICSLAQTTRASATMRKVLALLHRIVRCGVVQQSARMASAFAGVALVPLQMDVASTSFPLRTLASERLRKSGPVSCGARV